jgi:hypothetical protein
VPEPADSHEDGPPEAELELAEVRPLPVLAEPPEARALDRPAPPPLPVVVAVGTVGFIAGVLAWTLVRVLRRPRGSSAVRALGRRRRRGIEVAGTRSFLVDVHLLKR